MLAETRHFGLDHTTILSWVQCYAPEMEQRLVLVPAAVLIRAGAR